MHGKVYRKAYSSEFLFDFDQLDSPMEEEISTTSPTHSKEILILTHRIGHEITNHYRSRRFWISLGSTLLGVLLLYSFLLSCLLLDFFFRMGSGTDKKWNDSSCRTTVRVRFNSIR